jgi:uncharacterized protein (DUF433 family)
LRIPEEARSEIEATARRSRRTFSSVANEMLVEAARMRRIPGIVFADGGAGRRAKIAGTGLNVFTVVGQYREMGEDWERLREAYHWLSELQLRAALAYAQAFPEEIDEWLREEESWTQERVWNTYPFTRPPDR